MAFDAKSGVHRHDLQLRRCSTLDEEKQNRRWTCLPNRQATMDDDAFRFGIHTQRMNLKPAVQTAKHAEYAKGKGVERTGTFTRWENLSPLLIRSVFAWFAYFAVPSAFSR